MDEPCLESEECAVICEMLKVTDSYVETVF